MMKNTKNMVLTALLAAFTCIATMIIKFPTPTFGYIHLGDSLVLLCALLLGPGAGALAAGVGSMFADIFSGYIVWAPATLVIKALSAFLAGTVYHRGLKVLGTRKHRTLHLLLAGTLAEAFMVFGYFVFEFLLALISSSGAEAVTFTGAILASAASIPFNILQGVVGIAISAFLYPALSKIPVIRERRAHTN